MQWVCSRKKKKDVQEYVKKSIKLLKEMDVSNNFIIITIFCVFVFTFLIFKEKEHDNLEFYQDKQKIISLKN
jgi:hypothetical protein